ncbi:sensor histidine kinase [Kordiimonas gwangyangensis]|uniref:sensor histidine kinase n=1 Tax=Kordiimonas gwangyangensis TaxID=288022 RepID=UPI00037FD70C|nr:ATP-binding protein [Kordiimonas gwangyangensis]
MGFKKFSLMLAGRLGLIMISLLALTYLVAIPGYHAATLLVFFVVSGQTWEVFTFVSKTNAEITRFLDAARYADFSQRFNLHKLGAGFGELGETFTDILNRFQAARSHQEEELRHLKALIEHVPVPLMSIHADGTLVLWNNAARRLFGSAHVTRAADLDQFGEEFGKQVRGLEAGDRRLATFTSDDMNQQLALAATQIIIGGASEKLISLQNIQSELDVAQLQAWQDLVRVLTHEIMNSITPVASLAKTAVDLVEDISDKLQGNEELVEELGDVKDAVQTVARRSDSLMQFVSSYRRLTRLPPPEKTLIRLDDLFASVAKVATIGWEEKGIGFSSIIEPAELDVTADRDMIEQVLINMLRNAEQAMEGRKGAALTLAARLNRRGHAIVEVADNGPGIPADIAKKIFVPFFTTKRDGSGVGLALTRQVMIAHGGSVSVGEREGGGAKFTLTF